MLSNNAYAEDASGILRGEFLKFSYAPNVHQPFIYFSFIFYYFFYFLRNKKYFFTFTFYFLKRSFLLMLLCIATSDLLIHFSAALSFP